YQATPERSWRDTDGRLLRNETLPLLVERRMAERDTWQGRISSEFGMRNSEIFGQKTKVKGQRTHDL
ncbi:MAG: hypothetical protein J6T33_02740, partial [Bacteroidales bacterium]|nr:hypothetical protein [Bacteroidales bacterium]